MISKEQRATIVQKYGGSVANTGKPEVQIALLTANIQALSSHFEMHKKDNHSRRGLVMLVAKRKTLLVYLAKNDIQRYRDIIGALGLRK